MNSTERNNHEADRTVGAVECATEILLCFRQSGRLKLHDIHEATGLNKSRILRTAGTLVKSGFLNFEAGTKTYSLGAVFLSLAGTLEPELDRLKRAAQPILEALTAALGLTTMISLAMGEDRVVIARAEPELGLRYGVAIGQRRSLYHGATGTILLAFSGTEIDAASAWAKKPDEVKETYGDVRGLERAVQSARASGFALSRRGNAVALSVPIQLNDQTVALTVVGAVSDLNEDNQDTMRLRLADGAASIREALLSNTQDLHT